MKKKRKIEEIIVDFIDWSMASGKHPEEYHGKLVNSSSGELCYCETDGKSMICIPGELKDLILSKEVTVLQVVDIDTADAVNEAVNEVVQSSKASGDSGSLIDKIGAKPKTINIEF